MTDVHALVALLVEDKAFGERLAFAVSGDVDFAIRVAVVAYDSGHANEAIALCDHVLAGAPGNPAALRLSSRALAARGDVETGIERMISLKAVSANGAELVDDIRQLIVSAVNVQAECIASDKIARALAISELLVELCPGVTSFIQSAIVCSQRLNIQEKSDAYSAKLVDVASQQYSDLLRMADDAKARGDLEEELRYRVEISRHRLDERRHSGLRLDNIVFAVSRLLSVNIDAFQAERLNLAKELISLAATIPVSPRTGDEHADRVLLFDRFYRLILATIDVDAVFGPPQQPRPGPELTFASSTGAAMDISEVAARAEELGVEAVFFASASEEYFARYARAYASSILAKCDCSCMVIVCMAGGAGRLGKAGAELGIDDPRLILCADDFDPQSQTCEIYAPTEVDAITIPGPYYASVGLLCLGFLLERLRRPVFVSGIDTVLNRGVMDLLDRSKGVDVVLNPSPLVSSLVSQVINSLVLAFPTDNAMMFARFIGDYLGRHLSMAVYPAFIDQLDLLMARHHLLVNGRSPRIEYFDEFDINNAMFNQKNYMAFRQYMHRFRFLNMFVGGGGDQALKTEDVVSAVAS